MDVVILSLINLCLVPMGNNRPSLPVMLLKLLTKFPDGGMQVHLPLKKVKWRGGCFVLSWFVFDFLDIVTFLENSATLQWRPEYAEFDKGRSKETGWTFLF